MKTSSRISLAGWTVVIAVVLGLSGCGSASNSAANAQAKKKASRVQQHVDPSQRPINDMVAAVSASKGGPPVDMKFELRETPIAAQPLDVDIAIVATSPGIEHISGRFQPGEGFELIDGGELAAVDKPAPGTVIRHVVRLLPKQDGIFSLSGTVSVDTANDSITRTYAIPVIVGDGMPEQTAKAEVAEQPAPGTGSKTH